MRGIVDGVAGRARAYRGGRAGRPAHYLFIPSCISGGGGSLWQRGLCPQLCPGLCGFLSLRRSSGRGRQDPADLGEGLHTQGSFQNKGPSRVLSTLPWSREVRGPTPALALARAPPWTSGRFCRNNCLQTEPALC